LPRTFSLSTDFALGTKTWIQPKTCKQFSKHEKLVAVKLWKAWIPFRKIMKQCQMSKNTLWRVLKAPMQDRKKGTGRKATILSNILKQMKAAERSPQLDSQAVKGKGACLVCCKFQVDSKAVQGQAEDALHEDGHQASSTRG
jgi:hypothetical protein